MDIAPKILLQGAIQKKGINSGPYPYWENGFMFIRASSQNTPLNGMINLNSDRTQTVCVSKRKIGDTFYAEAYPAPCLD